MLPNNSFAVLNGGFTVTLAVVLTSAALLVTTARGDSSSDSTGIKRAAASGAPSPETTLTTGVSIELGPLGEREPGTKGALSHVSERIGTSAPGGPTASTLRDSPRKVARTSDMPVVERNAPAADREGAADMETAGPTFSVSGMLRLLVFVVVGILVMRRLQRRWNPHTGIIRPRENGPGNGIEFL